jgi:ferredoxin-NADP reductase
VAVEALPAVVVRRRTVADDVVALDLRRADGAALPAWAPGAHADLMLPNGLVRQYSLCGRPGDDGWRVAVLREDGGRGGSRAVHDLLHEGTPLEVCGPRNAFALEPAPAYLFVAGGIGITPILPMAARVAARGAPWRLAYGGRTAGSMAFIDELRALGGDLDLYPQDRRGLLPIADLVADAAASGAHVYCCGPEVLVDAMEKAAVALPPGRLHVERFRPPDAARERTPVAAAATDRPFRLELARAGLTLTVPAGRSALEVLEDARVPVLSSCREGTCGTCEVGVLAGEVDHRDHLLTPDERAAGDTMFVCVSRAAGERLVVDL